MTFEADESEPDTCPNCGVEQVNWGVIHITGDGVVIECRSCGSETDITTEANDE